LVPLKSLVDSAEDSERDIRRIPATRAENSWSFMSVPQTKLCFHDGARDFYGRLISISLRKSID
jgi:hypothetical protein